MKAEIEQIKETEKHRAITKFKECVAVGPDIFTYDDLVDYEEKNGKDRLRICENLMEKDFKNRMTDVIMDLQNKYLFDTTICPEQS